MFCALGLLNRTFKWYCLLSNHHISSSTQASMSHHTQAAEVHQGCPDVVSSEETNQNEGFLSSGPWRIHCPSAEAIWLQAPSTCSLNTSRWRASHNALLNQKLHQTISNQKTSRDHGRATLVQLYKYHFLSGSFLGFVRVTHGEVREECLGLTLINCKTVMVYYILPWNFDNESYAL